MDDRGVAPGLAVAVRLSTGISAQYGLMQQYVAKLDEYGLYGPLLLQPLMGLANTLLNGRPFTLGIWQVPALFTADKTIASIFELLHNVGAWAVFVLIG